MVDHKVGKRNSAADCIRCIALYCVISIHFFLNSGYYFETIQGKKMFILTVLRTAFMVCVPLFCILSGYLLCNKVYHKGYYKGLRKTLGTYILACGANIIWRIAYLKESITLKQCIEEIFNFSAAPYGWYVEMYIGLFLLTPFLNGLYHSLPDKRSKQGLLLTLLVLTALPSMINIYDFTTTGWWTTPAISNNYLKLFPSWWLGIWPISYYFWGMYLREYTLNIKTSTNALLYCLSVLLLGIFNFYRSYGVGFVWGEWQNWGALPNVIMSVLLFELLLKIRIHSLFVSRVLAKFSSLCLGGYLVSYIFDTAFYPQLIQRVPSMQNRLFIYPIITILIFFCSLLLSFFLQMLQSSINKICSIINRKLPKSEG